MAQLNVRTNVNTRVMTRAELCIDTAERFLTIAEDNNYDVSWYKERLELFIDNKFLSRLNIYGFDGEEPIAGVYIHFDWKRHNRFCIAYGETVEMQNVGEGDTFDSITEVIDQARAYINKLFAQGCITRTEVWFNYNDEKVEQYGRERIQEILQIEKSEEDDIENAARFRRIKTALNNGKDQSMVLPDLAEARVGVWTK